MAKRGRKKELLTAREEEVMQILWRCGGLLMREILEQYPEPKPHFNTVATQVRSLIDKNFVRIEPEGNVFRYFPCVERTAIVGEKLGNIVRGYFNNSYLGAVSALVEEEKISISELKELIAVVESQKGESNG